MLLEQFVAVAAVAVAAAAANAAVAAVPSIAARGQVWESRQGESRCRNIHHHSSGSGDKCLDAVDGYCSPIGRKFMKVKV